MSRRDGGQAYPAAWGNHEQGGDYVPGMTLRDWFAGQVLATASALPFGDENMRHYAKTAYDMADAMLAAREAEQ